MTRFIKSHVLILIWVLAIGAAPRFALAQESPSSNQSRLASLSLEKLVLAEPGMLPILISAPHGGSKQIPGVEPRQGAGMPKGGAGFVTVKDGGTMELAQALVQSLEERLGKRPYSVVSAMHRKYLDPNRPPHIAYEDNELKPVYDRYHDSMTKYTKEILNDFHAGLLVDLHGQAASRSTIYRGTNNGKTMKRLRERFGEQAHSGDKSFAGLLKQNQLTVFPDPLDHNEQQSYSGGYIVQTYGSHQVEGIDAIQLELGATHRTSASREVMVRKLTETICSYYELYLADFVR